MIMLKGWARFMYGDKETLVATGDCVHQAPGIVHYLFDYSEDMEYLEIVAPGRLQDDRRRRTLRGAGCDAVEDVASNKRLLCSAYLQASSTTLIAPPAAGNARPRWQPSDRGRGIKHLLRVTPHRTPHRHRRAAGAARACERRQRTPAGSCARALITDRTRLVVVDHRAHARIDMALPALAVEHAIVPDACLHVMRLQIRPQLVAQCPARRASGRPRRYRRARPPR